MELIRPFSGLGKGDAGIAGGKGASLGEMTQTGIPVPPGFVVLAGAFERFLEEADLNQELDAILDGEVNREEIRSVDLASGKIQQLITSAKMPEDIAREILENFKTLDAEHVAVRSSATAEDGATAAWAGQLETYLNTTEESVLENVQKCWASLFTPRAIFYRFEKGMHGSKISVAVVVQKMVQSEVSGIAFSVHPVTEDYNQLIIEAGFGLGEAIVSGQVTPDSYVIEKEPCRIIDKNVTYQSRALWRSEGGGNEWRELSEEEGNKPALSDEQALELAELVLKIERHYGFPCDIEWAFEAGTFYITQSRPITTLKPRVKGLDYPLNPEAELMIWGPANGKVLYTNWLKSNFLDFPRMYGLHWPTALQLMRGNRFVVILEQDELAAVGSKVFISEMLPKSRRELIRTKFKTGLRNLHESESNLQQTNLQNLTDKDFFPVWHDFLERVDQFWVHTIVPEIANYGSTQMLLEAIIPFVSEERRTSVMEVLTAPEDLSFYQEEEIELAETGDVATHAKKYSWIQNGFDSVHAVPKSVFVERKKELSSAVRAEHAERLRVARDKKTNVQQTYRLPDSAMEIAHAIVDAIVWQDIRKKEVLIMLQYLDALIDEIARRFHFEKEMLLNLTPQEINDLVAKRELLVGLEERKTAFGYVLKPGKIMVLDSATALIYWDTYLRPKTADIKELKGITACTGNGTAQGRVRIILDSRMSSEFQSGEILVTTMTTPEYIFVMKKAAAIVTDNGGLTSHAAIVSRELNVPCIVGTKFATQILKDGDMVEVDADRGIVRKLS